MSGVDRLSIDGHVTRTNGTGQQSIDRPEPGAFSPADLPPFLSSGGRTSTEQRSESRHGIAGSRQRRRPAALTQRFGIVALGITVSVFASGCGLVPRSSPATTTTPAATMVIETTAVATTAAPTTTSPLTTAAASTTLATESTTVATPPPKVAGPTTPAARGSTDWANRSYPINCLGIAGASVTLVNGEQQASEQNQMMSASLQSVYDAGGGSTVVLLSCEASAYVNGLHAVLVGADGNIDDDLDIGPVESLDGLAYTTPFREGWEVGAHPGDTASIQEHALSASGGRLTQTDGAIIPRCAPMGIDAPGLGRPAVSQGRLIAALQRRLIDLGYGGPIQASGGADGVMGAGTVDAFNQYFGDNWDYSDLSKPAAWYGDYEGGQPIPYWLDAAWTEILGIRCVGTYDPPVE